MKNHPHVAADKVRFSPADAERVRQEVERQHRQEARYQGLWIRFKRRREAERATGGGTEAQTRAAA